jgi:hypothetical protein
MDVVERCAIVADHSVVRCRWSAVANAYSADGGASPADPHGRHFVKLRRALDHGVVHDFGDSAFEHGGWRLAG